LYINIEHNFVEPRRTEMKTLLLNNEYLYKEENKFDDDYIHETTVIGTYYYQEDYTKPIIIKRQIKLIFLFPVHIGMMILVHSRMGF
jgi:hypothetical protein